MNLPRLSEVRKRLEDTAHDLEDAASHAKHRAASAVATLGTHAKATLDAHRAPPAPASAPPPSAASAAHTAQAAADFAKHAPPAEPHHATRGFFVAGSAGFAAALDSTAVGGQASAGSVLAEDGTLRPFVSGSSVTAGVALDAGVSAEVGYVHDSDAFFGGGEQVSMGIVGFSVNVGFTPDGKVNSASLAVGEPSVVPLTIVHSRTDTVGTPAQMKTSGAR